MQARGLAVDDLHRLVAAGGDLEIRRLVSLARAGEHQQTAARGTDLERRVVAGAVLGVGAIQGVVDISVRCGGQGDTALVSGWFDLMTDLEVGKPASSRCTFMLASGVLDPEVQGAFGRAEVVQVLDLVVLVGNVGLGRPINDRTVTCMAWCKAQHRLTGVRLDVDDGHVDSSLVLGERPLLDVAILAQTPATLFQGFGLERIQAAGTRHPRPDRRALGAGGDILPRGATVALAGRPQILLGLREAFVEVVLAQLGDQLVIGARAGQQFFDLRLGRLIALAELQPLVDGDPSQHVAPVHWVVGRKVQAVVGCRQRLAEATFRFFKAIAGFHE